MKCDFLQTRILSVFNDLKRVGFVFLFLGVQAAPASWQRIHVFEDETIWIVRFQNPQVGWAGTSSLRPFSLYRTTDGGTEWFSAEAFPTNVDVAEFAFFGDQRIAVATVNSVVTSNDSGESWNVVELPANGYVSHIAYGDSNVLIAVGTDNQAFPPTLKQIHRSLDGGQTWTREYFVIDPQGWSILCVAYSTTGTFIVGSAPFEVLRSTDMGDTWQEIGNNSIAEFPISGIASIRSPAPGLYYAAGVVDTSAGNLGYPIIARSRDDGLTWEIAWQDITAIDSAIFDLSFADSLHGWAVGRRGIFVETSDGGETWQKSVLDSIVFGLTDVSYLSPTEGFVFDPGGQGSLWRWDSVSAGVQMTPEIVADFSFIAYPNPFNSTLSISLEVPLHQEVSVVLFDLLGREVDVIYRGRLSSHMISYVAPATLSSGIYFLRVATANDVVLGKVVLLK